jgi:DNA invertase Pin-like site-specific DNA recombinase
VRRPAGYVRVSDPAGVERLTLATQERLIRERCAREGWPEPLIYREGGRSAFTDDLAKRPQLDKLVAALGRGEHDTLVVYDLDRFARNALLQLSLARDIRRLGCALVSLNQQVDLETPTGRMAFGMNAVVNELYSDVISTKTRDGLGQVRKLGGYVGGLPFGAKRDAGYKLVVDPARAGDLARLLELAESGAYSAAATVLNREGVRPPKTPHARNGVRPPLSAHAWRDNSVRSVVRACGWLLTQPAPWPARAAAALARPRVPRGNARKSVRMLTGLLRCTCGGVIVYAGYHLGRDGVRRYGVQCRRWNQEDRHSGYACPHPKRGAAHYERLVEAWLLTLPDLTDTRLPETPDLAAARVTLAEQKRMAYKGWQTGGLTEAEYDAAIAQADADERALPLPAGDGAAIGGEVRLAQALWPEATAPERNAILRRLVLRVVITGHDATVEARPELASLLAEWRAQFT